MQRLDPITAGGPSAAAEAYSPSRPARRSFAACFAPDLALSGALVTVIYLLLFFGGPSALFRDADAGWHIRAGERMIESRALPATDPFSFSKAGQPWIAWEWAADVAVGAVHRVAGLSGVAWLYAMAIGAATWMWFRLNWAAGGNFLGACLLAAPMLSTVNLHWLARPHVFGWLFALGTVWWCESVCLTRSPKSSQRTKIPRMWNRRFRLFAGPEGPVCSGVAAPLLCGAGLPPCAPSFRSALPEPDSHFRHAGRKPGGRAEALPHTVGFALCGMVWANVHGSFPLGPVIAFTYAVGWWLRPVVWGGERRSFVWMPAVAALLGSLANPHGWNLHRHVLAYLTDSALLDRIGEFQSFNFHAEGAAEIILALLIGAAGGFAALPARRPERFLLSILITAAALRSARMLPLAALLLLPLANGSICEVLTHARLAPGLRRALDSVLDYGSRLRAIDRGLSGMALVPVMALILFALVHATHPAFPADQFPVGAASAVEALPANARIFSSDKFGGYLIYRFAGERKVYFDGRSDFYGADFLKTYARLAQARPGWRVDFARQGFTHALLPPDYSLVAALEADGWKEAYRDPTAVLLKGPQS